MWLHIHNSLINSHDLLFPLALILRNIKTNGQQSVLTSGGGELQPVNFSLSKIFGSNY